MNERRKHKGINLAEYGRIHKIIRSMIRRAKSEWMKQECQQIEILQQRHDTHGEHKKLKETAGAYRKRMTAVLVDNNNKIITEPNKKSSVWKQYIERLFGDNDRTEYRNPTQTEQLTGPPITKDEIRKAIEQAKDNKSPGPDELPAEIIKMISEDNLHLYETLFNTIYDSGSIPTDWLRSTFIPIPKTHNARECDQHRLISLMSHTLKIYLKIIHKRIYKKCEANISDAQFGFRAGLGTREALFAIQALIQNCRDVRKDIFMCFVEYEKAFDRVQHEKLINILRRTDVDEKDIRCIGKLYWHQSAHIKTTDFTTEDILIQRGVRQGCVLSPLLFNMYSESIFDEALGNEPLGIKVNGVCISNIRYADDTILLGNSVEELQQILDKINNISKEHGLAINAKKTKFMIVSRDNAPYDDARLRVDNKNLERVSKYKYLGSWLHQDWNPDREIRCRIEMARSAFYKYKNILTCRDLNIELRMRYAKCYVWSVLLYGMEAWTMKATTLNKLESFEMWTYRRLLKIPWTDRVTNEEVLRQMRKERELLTIVKKRKVGYFGHIMRNSQYKLLQLIIEGKIEGRRGIGRKQMAWLRNIREWTGLRSIGELIHTASDREMYKHVIANVH